MNQHTHTSCSAYGNQVLLTHKPSSFSQKSRWPVVPPRKINWLEAVQFRNESEDPKLQWTSDSIKPLRLLTSTPCRGANPGAQNSVKVGSVKEPAYKNTTGFRGS